MLSSFDRTPDYDRQKDGRREQTNFNRKYYVYWSIHRQNKSQTGQLAESAKVVNSWTGFDLHIRWLMVPQTVLLNQNSGPYCSCTSVRCYNDKHESWKMYSWVLI